MYKYGKSSEARFKGVHPDMVRFARILLYYSRYDLGISEGVRSVETQQKLYASGRTKPGPWKTNCDGIKVKSNHQTKDDGYGYALDIFPYDMTTKKPTYSDEYMNYIGNLGKAISVLFFNGKIHWGGDYSAKYRDAPHWELLPNKTPLTQKDIKLDF